MMKKVFAVLLSSLLLCSAAACSQGGKSGSPDGTTAAVTEAATEEVTEEATEAVTAPEPQITAANDDIEMMLGALKGMDFSGVVYAERDGEPIAVYVGGVLDNRVPVALDTPMPVGSITKQFCAASILLLQEQGKLSVEDTLDKYYPDYQYGDKITLHNLLSMRSGVVNFDEKTPSDLISMEKTDAENTDALLGWVFEQPLNFEPDTKYEYSNFNYVLLANIAEKATGERWNDFMRESFFEPLGMEHTGFVDELADSPAWAEGFAYQPSQLSPGIEPGVAKGAGSVISTAADMTKWMNSLTSGKIISEESYQAMTTAYSTTGNGYGYGLMTDFGGGVGHFGNIGIFTAGDYIYEKKNITLFVASNAGGTSAVTSQFFNLTAALQR